MSPRGTVVQGLVGIGFGLLFLEVCRRLRRPGWEWFDTYPWPRDLYAAVSGILGWVLIVGGIWTVVVALVR
jgi:hypothetical protein